MQNNSKKKIYLASPLFSEAERRFNAELKKMLSKHCQVYLPQEDGGLWADLTISGMTESDAKKTVFEGDLSAIRQSNIVIAVLDGCIVDDGVAFEIGFAFALGIQCIGLQTDSRHSSGIRNNPMIEGAIERIFFNQEDLVSWVSKIEEGHELEIASEIKNMSLNL